MKNIKRKKIELNGILLFTPKINFPKNTLVIVHEFSLWILDIFQYSCLNFPILLKRLWIQFVCLSLRVLIRRNIFGLNFNFICKRSSLQNVIYKKNKCVLIFRLQGDTHNSIKLLPKSKNWLRCIYLNCLFICLISLCEKRKFFINILLMLESVS